MDRRKFIKEAGILGGTALLPLPRFAAFEAPTYKMGYQLYSIRDEMGKDPVGTLKALKEMGYQDFEAYGFDAEQGMYYGYKSAEFKQILDDLALTVTSGHYGFSPYLEKSEEDLNRFVERCIIGAHTINSKYITWPWIAPEQRTLEHFKMMAQKLNSIGELGYLAT